MVLGQVAVACQAALDVTLRPQRISRLVSARCDKSGQGLPFTD